MTDHARLSPSSAHRWMTCPGSVREEARYPDSDNAASIDGTKSHILLSECLQAGRNATDVIGVMFNGKFGADAFLVDKERADRVQIALDYVATQRKLYGGDCVVTIDRQVDPLYLVGRKDLRGTLDVCIEAPGVRVLEIIDYKDGFVDVPAQDNVQLELYALGVLSELQIPHNLEYPFDLVRMTIVQPKNLLKGREAIVGWEMPVRALLDRVGHFAVAAAATDDPEAPLVPGESQCRWCRAKGSCSALAASVLGEMGAMFAPVAPAPAYAIIEQSFLDGVPFIPFNDPRTRVAGTGPEVSIAETAATQDPNTLSDDKIRQVLEAAPLLRQFIESVEEEALRRLKSGTAIPGLKVVHGRGSRAWAFPEDDIAAKLVKMGVPKGSVYETKLISPAKAEKVTWTKRDGTPMQLTKGKLDLMRKEYVITMAGKLTVVPASDERPAVEFDAAPLFKAISEAAALGPTELPRWLT